MIPTFLASDTANRNRASVRVIVFVVIVGAVVVWLSAPVRAQGQNDLEGLNRFSGEAVFVQDKVGRETLARVVVASAADLTVLIGGVETRIPASDVRLVSRPGGDSLKNGALIGGGIGFAWGAFASLLDDNQTYPVVAGGLIGAGVVAAIGAWIDHRHKGREVVYKAPAP